MNNIDFERLTPMMKQYVTIKKQNQDAILFFRLGDFYEMFFDDAIIASKELELALTSRECGLDEKAAMCGVPHHVADNYVNKLVEKGYKVAIVDQVEDPKEAKGIVKRSITRLVTPGTLIELDNSQIKENNFLLSIFEYNKSFGITYVDITTGEIKTTEIISSQDNNRELIDFIVKIEPKEIILNKKIDNHILNNYIENNNIFISYIDVNPTSVNASLLYLKKYLDNKSIKLLEEKNYSIYSTKNLIEYIYLFQDEKLPHISQLEYIQASRFMKIDANTRENLEIHRNLNDNGRRNTLFNTLDKTSTAMGSRMLNSWLEFPLLNIDDLIFRQNLIEFFVNENEERIALKSYLNKIYDLERILSKLSYSRANGRDLLALANSIENLPKIKKRLNHISLKEVNHLFYDLDDLSDIYKLIKSSIVEDAPITITEGNLIKAGFSEELDKLKSRATEGKRKLLLYEESERERTGIKNLRVSYNKNTGYYIELTKSNIKFAPENYTRRQTLKNTERYITDELNNISDMILGSETDTVELEHKIFNSIKNEISKNTMRIKDTSYLLAYLDTIISLAQVAVDNSYVRPQFNSKGLIKISNGRHPVIENTIKNNDFIPNNTNIGQKDNLIQIITGPNMAGKSTYMRQVALIILMAQIGSFVPASNANLSISDAIFTRIGASDNLAKGDSTFMVEMKEMSNIINNASKDSFVVLDEVGRGTSTNDGLSIAYAIVEYISQFIQCKTLFATHYHELTDLEKTYTNVKNLKVDIDEYNGELIFLRKILRGTADRSYGIEVAKLSGLPDPIIRRANYILAHLDDSKIDNSLSNNLSNNKENLLVDNRVNESYEDFERNLLLKEVEKLDLDSMSAKQAYDYLYEFKARIGDI